MVTAILIDPELKTISHFPVTDNRELLLKEIYTVIACNSQKRGKQFENGEELIVDEFGFKKADKPGFAFNVNEYFFGKALIIGYDAATQTIIDCTLDLQQIKKPDCLFQCQRK